MFLLPWILGLSSNRKTTWIDQQATSCHKSCCTESRYWLENPDPRDWVSYCVLLVWEGVGSLVYFSSLYPFVLFCLTFADYKISKNHIQAQETSTWNIWVAKTTLIPCLLFLLWLRAGGRVQLSLAPQCRLEPPFVSDPNTRPNVLTSCIFRTSQLWALHPWNSCFGKAGIYHLLLLSSL